MDPATMPPVSELQKCGPDHPCCKMRLQGRQNNLPEEFCMASTKSGKPCTRRKDENCALPFCAAHREGGDGAFRIVPHPRAGHVLVANFDIPKGYKTVFWGTRKTWKATENTEGEDYAMCFRSNGGVIDPTTHKKGSQMQFMSNPGPNERQNMRSTNEFYGKTYEDGLVGREFVVMADVKKSHQLLIFYGNSWFDARGIDRIDVGTKRYPATLRDNALNELEEKHAAKGKKSKSSKPFDDVSNKRRRAAATA